ncbi:MAG: hypothetical protein HQL03_00790 [Nitrospirae bacterium]|nr:hypothetical protein [Nitrospirota bacterium]
MRNPEDIMNDNFSLDDIGHKRELIAFLSLKAAIKAYFSTYTENGCFLGSIMGDNAFTPPSQETRSYEEIRIIILGLIIIKHVLIQWCILRTFLS